VPNGNNQADFSMPWITTFLPLRELVSAPLKIIVSNPVAPANNELAVSISLTALQDITAGQLKLYVAIVEKQLNGLNYVMRKMLPNASGIPLTLPIVNQTTLTFDLDPWEVKNVTSLQELAIVAFVQDEQTKDVLQSEAFDLNNPLPNLPTTTTGLSTGVGETVTLYPNPANNQVRVQFPRPVQKVTSIKLTDPIGNLVHQSNLPVGTDSKTIGTQDFASGLYVMQIDSGNGTIVVRKIMIVHGDR
jgi:hypothetical protein